MKHRVTARWWCASALLALCASAGALVLSPDPDLAVEFGDDGRITGLSVAQRPRPVLGLGGFELADLAAGGDDTLWCPVPAGELSGLGHGGQPSLAAVLAPAEGQPAAPPRWLFGGGWALAPVGVSVLDDQGIAHGTAVAQLPAGDDAAGSLLRLVCPVAEAAREGASFTLTLLVSGAPPGRLGVLALNSGGRAVTTWIPCQPAGLRGEWREWTARVFAPPGTAGLMAMLVGEPSQAPLACAGARLTTHRTARPEPVDGQLKATTDGATFSGRVSGLRLTADYRLEAGALRIKGRLSAEQAGPRAVCLTFRLPLDGAGWRWWHNPRRPEPIPPSSLHTLCSWQHLGDGHLYSPWPLGCVSRDAPAGELVLAQPTEQPLLARFGFRQEDGLYASLDLGLDPASGHDSVPFELAVFAAEPRWGMRSALERHAVVFPPTPSLPAPHGAWFAGIDPAAVGDPLRLGLRYDEGAAEHAEWAARHRLVGVSRWQPWAVDNGEGAARRDPAGQVWHPRITVPGPSLDALLAKLDGGSKGVVVDGLATSWAGWDIDITDAAQWAATDLPLSASRTRRQPALPAAILHLELLASAAERLRRQGRLVVGGPDPSLPLPWVLPYLDVLTGGLRAPGYEHLLWLRALAPGKPLTYLEPNLLNAATMPGVQAELWSDALLVGAFPGAVGLLSPELAGANASWFARHLPLLGPLAATGWRLVPHAATNDELVEVQRYGSGDSLALVVRNGGPRERSVRLWLQPAALDLVARPGAPLPELVDLLATPPTALPLTVEYDRWHTGLVLSAGQTMVLRPRATP